MRSARALFAFASLALAGCPLAPLGVAEGGRCVRSTQCNGGLVCSAAGICTSDLMGFGTGMVPVVDAAGIDAGMLDAGDFDGGAFDAGDFDGGGPIDAPIVPMDTPVIPMDTPVPMDTPAPFDAGMPDAGEDAPVADPDAPVADPDAPAEDAG